MNRIRKRFRIFAGTKLKDKNVKYNFFQTIKKDIRTNHKIKIMVIKNKS